MKTVSIRIFYVLWALVSLFCSSAKAAPDPYMDPQVEDKRKPSYGIDDISNVDAFSGRLNLNHTDISLRGVGPDVSVTRIYHSSLKVPEIVNVPMLDSHNAFGFGWDIHFGRVFTKKYPSNTDCGEQPTYTDDNPSLELADGSRQNFYLPLPGSDVPHHMISDHSWVMDCGFDGSRSYFIVTDQSGTKYTFDFRGVYATLEGAIINEPVKYAWYLRISANVVS